MKVTFAGATETKPSTPGHADGEIELILKLSDISNTGDVIAAENLLVNEHLSTGHGFLGELILGAEVLQLFSRANA